MNQLPERPNLEHLKAQAKELLTTLRSGDDASRFAAVFPDRSPTEAKLADAQHIVAREYGFESWPKLKAHVEGLGQSLVEQFITLALADGGYAKSAEFLAAHPEVTRDLAAAACAGDPGILDRLDDVNAPIGTLQWPAFAYVCASSLMQDPARKPQFKALVAAMLERGADPDTAVELAQFPDNPLSVLYWTGARNDSPEIAELLLERGANTRDNESLYHSAEHRDHRFLKLLIKHNIDPSQTNALKRMLDYEDMEGLNLLLSIGIDPNEYDDPALHHAIRRGRSPQIIARLIDAGADPSARNPHGVKPYDHAISMGMDAVAEVIKEKGGDADLSPEAELLQRAHRGEVLGRDEVARLAESVPTILHFLAERNQHVPLKALLDAGYPPDLIGTMYKYTPIMQACHGGNVESVRVLLDAGADLTIRDGMYDGWPIGWAMHGSTFFSQFHDWDGSRYRRIVQMLIDAGTPIPEPPTGRPDLVEMLTKELERRRT